MTERAATSDGSLHCCAVIKALQRRLTVRVVGAARQPTAPTILIALTVGFGVTLLLRWHGREAQHPDRSLLPPVAAAPAIAFVPAQGPAATDSEAQATLISGGAVQSVTLEAQSAPAPESTAPPLPVRLLFQYRGVHGDAQDGVGESPKLVVRMVNASTETLPLNVSVASAARNVQSHLEIVLGPHQSKELGADDGLEIQSGDVIKVSSANFRDLVHRA